MVSMRWFRPTAAALCSLALLAAVSRRSRRLEGRRWRRRHRWVCRLRLRRCPPRRLAALEPDGGAVTLPEPEGGASNACLGKVAAGMYATAVFQPDLTYTVPGRLGELRGPARQFPLPPGGSPEGVNPGRVTTSAYLPQSQSPAAARGSLQTEPRSFDGLVAFLKKHPRLKVSNVHDVIVGGLKGVRMDIRMGPKPDCNDGAYVDLYVGLPPSDLVHGVIPNYLVRVYLLRSAGNTLAIEVADAPNGSDYADFPAAAAQVIETFKFAT